MVPTRSAPTRRRLTRAAALLAAGSALATATAAPAQASSGFFIHGAGDGHGIGMSQYGAMGLALHGYSYNQILSHYYEGSQLSSTNPAQTVTVLLAQGSASFSGASSAGGHSLGPGSTYSVHPATGGRLQLFTGAHEAGTFTAPLVVRGSGPLTFGGSEYHGSLVFRPDGAGGVQTVNSVDLEDYIRGVVAAEMPSSWPMAALEAQAVAARTYALTAGAAGTDFEVYSDTRSQMYEGVSAETSRTDAAIEDTRGRIVTYDGRAAVTYFFASSGGHTESIQNVWQGVAPEAWLTGVPDPYDNSGANPYYRWNISMSLGTAAAKLRGLVKGSFQGIVVTRHGVSPRIVTAAVVGTKGRTTVTGAQLQQIFGLMSTYASFTSLTAKKTTRTPATTPSSSGGAGVTDAFWRLPSVADLAGASPVLTGSLFPAVRGSVVEVEREDGNRYVVVARLHVGASGSYSFTVRRPGRYRVQAAGTTASPVTFS